MSRRTGVVFALLAAAVAAGVVVLVTSGHGPSPAVVRGERVARRSPCDRPPVGRLTYHWPVKPFDRQHPIRGNFGDPRTLTSESFGADTPRSPGSFSFHNGIDIAAPVGTPVYPVVSGVAELSGDDEIIVHTSDGRTFQYWHLVARVRTGSRVSAYRTVLGTIRREAHHVHLTEIDGFRVHDPVAPGHLEPYRDRTPPVVIGLVLHAAGGGQLDPERLAGRVVIEAEARDLPPLSVPGEWLDFPVTPAFVAWRMTTASGRVVVPETTVVDFRTTEPPNRDFWRVYAAGTYQNFPVFGHRYFWHVVGRYVFRLTDRPLDTRTLRNGEYEIRVDVADVCGNRGSLGERVRIANAQPPAPRQY